MNIKEAKTIHLIESYFEIRTELNKRLDINELHELHRK